MLDRVCGVWSSSGNYTVSELADIFAIPSIFVAERVVALIVNFAAPLRGVLITAVALGLGLGALAASATSAAAQTYYADPYSDIGGPSAKVRKSKKKAAAAAAKKAKAEKIAATDAVGSKKKQKSGQKDAKETAKAVTGPLVISVSLGRQKLAVFDGDRVIAESPISSGRVGYGTPTGVFSIVEKNRVHHSNLYAGAPMPNMQRITWSGVALHAGALPGYPASHGCIRLPHGFSSKLFGMTKLGTRVIVARDLVVPRSYSSDLLFAAYPPESDQAAFVSDGKTLVADASNTTVPAAVGGAVVDDAPRPLSFRERRALEAAKLSSDIREAGFKRQAAEIEFQSVQRETAAVIEPAKALAADLEKLEAAVRANERAEDETLSSLERLVRIREGKAGKVKKVRDIDGKIAALEAKVGELTAKADEAAQALKAARERSVEVLSAADAAETKLAAARLARNEAASALASLLEAEKIAKKREAKRALPVSVFVSRAKSRLFVRQGYEPIFDVPVTFERPDEPLGTHVFTALDYAPSKTAMTWSVTSVPFQPKADKKAPSRKDKGKTETVASVDVSKQTPDQALARLSIPQDAREQIADVMKPGSSLIISDHPLSPETGEYTDFIVPLR